MTPAPTDDLRLLTAQEAAAELGVDVKTLRLWSPPAIVLGGGTKRYTRALLRDWLAQQRRDGWQVEKRSPSRAKNTSRAGQGRITGKSHSPSTVIEFEKAAGLRTR